MKKRRTLIIALLLISALALGIGYATVSGDLFIHGKVTTAPQTFDVVITEYTMGNANRAGIAGTTDALDGGVKSVVYNVTGMSYADDYLEGTFTVKNRNDITMYLQNPVITYGDEDGMFKVEWKWVNEAEVADGLEENEEAELKITVTMLKGASDTLDKTFTIKVHATSDEP